MTTAAPPREAEAAHPHNRVRGGDAPDRSPARMGHRYPVQGFHGLIFIELARIDEARSSLQAGLRIAEQLGAQLHLPT